MAKYGTENILDYVLFLYVCVHKRVQKLKTEWNVHFYSCTMQTIFQIEFHKQ
jgi:hypothetical protein